jgi:hypothetical protein
VRILQIPFWMTQTQHWLSRRVWWIPEPGLPRRLRQSRRPSLAYRWRTMSGKQRGWVLFAIFWGGAVALSIFGNLIPQ